MGQLMVKRNGIWVPAARGPRGPAGLAGTDGQPRQVRDEGTALPVRAAVDFVGAGVTATDDSAGDRTKVTVPGSSAPGPAPAVGRWVIDPAAGTGSYGQGENDLWLLPSWLPGGTYDGVALHVASAGSAGAVVRAAVYAEVDGSPSGAPLLAQSAPVDATATGVKAITLTAPFVVPPGGAYVWRGAVIQGVATTRPSFTRATGHLLPFNTPPGSSLAASDLTSSTYPQNFIQSGVSGAPPATFTGTTRFDSGPRMAFRRSA